MARSSACAAGSKGLIVSSVIAKSPAATLGIKIGDLVTEMNDEKVETLADFYAKLNDPKSKSVKFTLARDGQTLTTLALVRK